MVLNVFDLLNEIFKGVVSFFYNVISSYFRLLFRPFSGPARLYERYLDQGVNQVAPWTFLMISFFLYLLGIPKLFATSNLELGTRALPAIALGDKDAGFIFLLLLIGAVTAAVIVDVTLRLIVFARWPQRQHARHREAVLGVIEYALSIAPLTVGLLQYPLLIASLEIHNWHGS